MQKRGLKASRPGVDIGQRDHDVFFEPPRSEQCPVDPIRMVRGADGVADAQSAFVAQVMRNMLSGVFTVAGDDLLKRLLLAHETQGIRLEPSAAASLAGPEFILRSPQGQAYCEKQGIQHAMPNAIHICWTTGVDGEPSGLRDRNPRRRGSVVLRHAAANLLCSR